MSRSLPYGVPQVQQGEVSFSHTCLRLRNEPEDGEEEARAIPSGSALERAGYRLSL